MQCARADLYEQGFVSACRHDLCKLHIAAQFSAGEMPSLKVTCQCQYYGPEVELGLSFVSVARLNDGEPVQDQQSICGRTYRQELGGGVARSFHKIDLHELNLPGGSRSCYSDRPRKCVSIQASIPQHHLQAMLLVFGQEDSPQALFEDRHCSSHQPGAVPP